MVLFQGPMHYFLPTCVFTLLCFTACNDVSEKDKALIDQLIQNEVNNRINIRKTTSLNRCMDAIYAEASEIADSILLLEARTARDTSLRPMKPIKPEKPEIIELKDSTPVQPFLKDSIQKD